MKTYIVESQIAIAVVAVNDGDGPIQAVHKFLRTQGISESDQEIEEHTKLFGGDLSGAWENLLIEGTYILRAFIV